MVTTIKYIIELNFLERRRMDWMDGMELTKRVSDSDKLLMIMNCCYPSIVVANPILKFS